MPPAPRRKDRTRSRERPAGLEPAEETAATPEEYTDYRETGEEGSRGSAEAEREADLQPGRDDPSSRRPGS